jgi:hypothetical protein
VKPKGGGAVYGPRVQKLELQVIRLEAELGKAREESVRIYGLLRDLAEDHLDLMEQIRHAETFGGRIQAPPKRRLSRSSVASYSQRPIPTRTRSTA